MVSTFKKPERVKVDALGYLQEVLKNGLVKDVKENEVICSSCKGTGLMITNQPFGIQGDSEKRELFPYKNQYIVSCENCYGGIVNVCEHCGEELSRGKLRCECERSREIRREKEAEKDRVKLEKAIKVTVDDEIYRNMGMCFHESYPFDNGYFTDIEEFMEWWKGDRCGEENEDRPEYVWGTVKMKMSIDAESVVEQAVEDLHEDALGNVVRVDELQKFLDEWVEAQVGTETYYDDSKYAVKIPWEK